jgi:signal transduction histidine kinase
VGLRDRMLRMAGGRRLPRRSLRLRLTLLYGVVFLLSGAALLTTTYFLVDAATGNAFIVHGKNGVTFAGYQIGSEPPTNPGAKPETITNGGLSISVAHGTARQHGTGAGAGGYLSTPVNGNPPTAKQQAQQQRQIEQQQHELEALAHAYQSKELHQLLIESGFALGIMVLVSIALGYVVAGRALRPLRTITATTRDISASNLDERLAVDGPDDELKELGDTIDGLLERLEAAFRSQRQFVANASHELRTPLARQRTLAQVALSDPEATEHSLRAAHERILASGDQQEQLIDALLTLSRVQGGTVLQHAVDLEAVVGELLDARQDEAEVGGLRVVPDLAPATLQGDQRLVERLIANLLDNAMRHNVEGGKVNVQTGSRRGAAWLVVANDGPVIKPGEVERLFEPFERLGAERTAAGEGFGLGLCIVGAVAAAHDATLHTVARPEGGLSIEVRFPARSSGPEEAARRAADGPPAGKGPAVRRGRHPEGQAEEPAEPVHALLYDH